MLPEMLNVQVSLKLSFLYEVTVEAV